MKARYRLSKRLIALVLFISIFLAAYLHFGLLPGNLKKAAIDEIEKVTPFRVAFDKLVYLPFEGFSFHNLKVWEKNGQPVFLSKKLSVNAKLVPFLKEKKIIISNVYLDSPVYEFLLEPRVKTAEPAPLKTKLSGQITVPVVPGTQKVDLNSIEEGPNAFLPENVYLEGIQILNGLVVIKKNSEGLPLETISDIHIRMGFLNPPILTFDGSLKLGDRPYASLALKGRWDLEKANYEFDFETKSGKVPSWLLDYQKKNFLILHNAEFLLNTHLKSIGEEKASFQAKTRLRNSKLLLNKTEFTGEMGLEVDGVFNFERKAFERYKGRLDLVKVDIANLSKNIQHLENIEGQVDFQPDLLTIQSVRGQYKKLAFDANGTIRSFKDLILNADIRANSSITEVFSLIPDEQKKALKGFDVQGACSAVTTVSGSLRKPAELQTDYRLLIEQASVKNPEKKIDISNLTAEVLADNTGIKVRNGRFAMAAKSYDLNAFIPKEPQDRGALELSSEGLHLTAAYSWRDATLLIHNATFENPAARATFQGKLTNLNKPFLEIQGELETDLVKAVPLLAAKAPNLKNAGLKGTLRGNFILNGLWNDPLNWDLQIDAQGSPIFIKDKIRLDNFDVQVRMKNKVLRIPYLHATPYSGTLGITGLMDFSKPGTFFDVKLSAYNLNLYPLGRDLDLKQKDFSGTAVFQLAMNGILKSPETFRGSGAIDIRNGRLLQTNLFKQMGDLVVVKVEGFDLVVIQAMNATFDIYDKRIWTQNLNLFGNTVHLDLDGSIGFDQTLDLLMDIRYSPDILRGAQDVGGIVPFVVAEAADFISQYKIRGTLKEPKYDKKPLPVGSIVGKKLSSLIQSLSQ